MNNPAIKWTLEHGTITIKLAHRADRSWSCHIYNWSEQCSNAGDFLRENGHSMESSERITEEIWDTVVRA